MAEPPTASPTDEELMARYVTDSDPAAFRELFDRYGGRLHGYFLREAGSSEIAADLVQTTFLHLHRARLDFRQGLPLRPWLFTIAANVRREHARKRFRRPETPLDPLAHSPVAPTVAPDASTATERVVQRAVEALPEPQREVILLRWYAGLSFAEIASALGATPGAVRVRAHRALAALRSALGGSDG